MASKGNKGWAEEIVRAVRDEEAAGPPMHKTTGGWLRAWVDPTSRRGMFNRWDVNALEVQLLKVPKETVVSWLTEMIHDVETNNLRTAAERFVDKLYPPTLQDEGEIAIGTDEDRERDQLARIAAVFNSSMDSYKDQAKALVFLGRPHAMLKGRTPFEVALGTASGADVVINLLGRAAHGGGA